MKMKSTNRLIENRFLRKIRQCLFCINKGCSKSSLTTYIYRQSTQAKNYLNIIGNSPQQLLRYYLHKLIFHTSKTDNITEYIRTFQRCQRNSGLHHFLAASKDSRETGKQGYWCIDMGAQCGDIVIRVQMDTSTYKKHK